MTNAHELNRRMELWGLCLDCAEHIPGTQPADYCRHVANLLYGTAAVESGLIARRQYGYDYLTPGGAWGLWQIEAISVRNTMQKLAARADLERVLALWLFQGAPVDVSWWKLWSVSEICRAMTHDDRLACAFARLHYYWHAEPVPAALGEQAAYWKRYYNTVAGKGTEEAYMLAYEKYRPSFGGD